MSDVSQEEDRFSLSSLRLDIDTQYQDINQLRAQVDLLRDHIVGIEKYLSSLTRTKSPNPGPHPGDDVFDKSI